MRPGFLFVAGSALCAFNVAFGASASTLIHITGRVASSQNDAPIAGAAVDASVPPIYNSIGSTTTGPDGRYEMSVSCPGVSCSLLVGATGYQSVSSSFTTADIDIVRDFHLTSNGFISGTIALAPGSLANGTIEIRAERWQPSSSTWVSWTGATLPATGGDYTLSEVLPGTYRVCAGAKTSGLRRQCFDAQDQGPMAGPVTYTPVVVEGGAIHSGVNFVLRNGGSIEGRLWDGYRDAPLISDGAFYASIIDTAGQEIKYFYGPLSLDAGGHYSLGGLAPGEYYLLIGTVDSRYKDNYQYYPAAPCTNENCGDIPSGATRIVVAPLAAIHGIDFNYHPYSVLRGQVKARATGESIPNARVAQWHFGGSYGSVAPRDPSTGEYIFYLSSWGERPTADAAGYVPQAWPEHNCYIMLWECAFATPTVTLAADEVRTADILLDTAGVLPINVHEIHTGYGIDAMITVYAADGSQLWQGPNRYTTFTLPTMLAGPVFVKAETATRCEVYAHRPCPAAGNPIASVQPTTVQVTASTPEVVFEFAGDAVFADGFDGP